MRIPTLNGAVELAISRTHGCGPHFRLKGKGMPLKGGGAGDLFATIRIAVPSKPDETVERLCGSGVMPVRSIRVSPDIL